MSLLGDSHIASARRSRSPSSLCSMEDMWRRPKFSGQLPHTSSKVTLRSKAPSTDKRDTCGTPWHQPPSVCVAFWVPEKLIFSTGVKMFVLPAQHSTAEPKVWTSFEQAAVRKMVKLKYRPSSGLTLVRVRKAAQ